MSAGYPMKAAVQSWVASTRDIKTTWSSSRKCIVGEGISGCSLRTTATTRNESGSRNSSSVRCSMTAGEFESKRYFDESHLAMGERHEFDDGAHFDRLVDE